MRSPRACSRLITAVRCPPRIRTVPRKLFRSREKTSSVARAFAGKAWRVTAGSLLIRASECIDRGVVRVCT